ncbi:hypothetical protein SCHPADRAFT_46754 [Schizopora paradoxa]|uniref:F-box domain-containing protein n=1 Tax=Schizopora paradoxa TaxID=27342 RepID=A0A0H2S6U5_9AGAM|nr:hypothetical protein SCHPADRAFT_46754 [Schizopora paradoxa]
MVASTTKPETSFSCNLSNFPPDVLSQIFRFSIHGDIMTHWYDVEETRIPTKVDTPWPLMLVCRSWFNVVSWDTVLWSTFAVTIRQPVASHENLSRLPLFLEHYLRQSGEAPLTIKIVLAGGQRTNRKLAQETTLIHDIFNSLLTIAMNHCDRWRHISLRLRPGYHIESLMGFSLPLKRMPILKSFEVENYAGWPITIDVDPHSELEALHLMGAVKPLLEEGIPRQDLAAGFPNLRRVRVVPAVTYYDQHHNFRWKILQLSPQVEEVDIFRASLAS